MAAAHRPQLFAGALKAVGAISPGNALDRGRMAFRFLTRYRARKTSVSHGGGRTAHAEI
jgi:hypothetical protein